MLFIFNFCFLLHFGTRSSFHASFLSLNFDPVQHNHTIFVLLLVNYIKLIFTILLIEKNDQMKLKTSLGTEGEHCGIPPVHVFCNYIYVTPMLHLSLAPYMYHPIATITDQAPLHQVTDRAVSNVLWVRPVLSFCPPI